MKSHAKNVLGLLLLLLAICIYKTKAAALFQGCDYEYSLQPGISYLESPNYSNWYPAYTSCRYRFTAPLDYDVAISCSIYLDKGANGCSTEFFYVSTDGDKQLRGAEQFCGQGTVTRKSLFRSITLAYASYGSYGRFQCRLEAKQQACDCGWSVNTKIVGGVEASPNEYPSMVALRDTTSNLQAFCAAAIISHRYLLTAAHCTRVQPIATNIVAMVGEHNLQNAGETKYEGQYQIQAIIEHPYYTPDPVTNDIALLRTVANIEWSRGVGPICLPPPDYVNTDFAYYYVDVVGWGSKSFGGPTSATLQKIQLQVVANSACQNAYKDIAPITPKQVCTFDYNGKGRDSCQYDSGGPVILRASRQFCIGVISFGKVCGAGGTPTGVNTRITSYLSWIQQNSGYSTCPVSSM